MSNIHKSALRSLLDRIDLHAINKVYGKSYQMVGVSAGISPSMGKERLENHVQHSKKCFEKKE